jgi:hypothetical protein
MQTFSAEGVNGSEAPHSASIPASPDGVPRKPNTGGAESWAVSAPKVRCERWPWLSRRGAVTRGCVRRVKGRRMKQRQEAPRCKGGMTVQRHAGGLYRGRELL